MASPSTAPAALARRSLLAPEGGAPGLAAVKPLARERLDAIEKAFAQTGSPGVAAAAAAMTLLQLHRHLQADPAVARAAADGLSRRRAESQSALAARRASGRSTRSIPKAIRPPEPDWLALLASGDPVALDPVVVERYAAELGAKHLVAAAMQCPRSLFEARVRRVDALREAFDRGVALWLALGASGDARAERLRAPLDLAAMERLAANRGTLAGVAKAIGWPAATLRQAVRAEPALRQATERGFASRQAQAAESIDLAAVERVAAEAGTVAAVAKFLGWPPAAFRALAAKAPAIAAAIEKGLARRRELGHIVGRGARPSAPPPPSPAASPAP